MRSHGWESRVSALVAEPGQSGPAHGCRTGPTVVTLHRCLWRLHQLELMAPVGQSAILAANQKTPWNTRGGVTGWQTSCSHWTSCRRKPMDHTSTPCCQAKLWSVWSIWTQQIIRSQGEIKYFFNFWIVVSLRRRRQMSWVRLWGKCSI